MTGSRVFTSSIGGCLIALCGNAMAHSQVGDAGLQAGFMHPLTGPDHVLAMIAVGMVSVVLGASAVWQVPATFLLSMLVGAIGGYAGWAIPRVELGIATSVILLGVVLAVPALRTFRRIIFLGVVVFGLCHGNSHGLELPHSAAPLQYSFGFLVASLFLHVCGLFGADALSETRLQIKLRRSIGALMTAAGIWFFASALIAR